ncbi:MAG: DUF1127 domain-containing protein [Pseudomonadota bacterium]
MQTLLNRFRTAWARRAAARELRGYDARQLRDLGIARDEIDAFVAGRAHRRSAEVISLAERRALAARRPYPTACCAAA